MFRHETSAAYTSPITVGQDRSVLVNFNSSGGFEILDVDAATGNTTDVSGDTTAFLTPVCTCMLASYLIYMSLAPSPAKPDHPLPSQIIEHRNRQTVSINTTGCSAPNRLPQDSHHCSCVLSRGRDTPLECSLCSKAWKRNFHVLPGPEACAHVADVSF